MKCWTHTWAEISLDFTSELWVILVVCVALISRLYFMSKDQLTTDHSYNPLSTQCPHLLSIFIWTIHLQPRRQVKLLAVKPLTPFPLYSPPYWHFYKVCHITFTLHIYHLTFILVGRREQWWSYRQKGGQFSVGSSRPQRLEIHRSSCCEQILSQVIRSHWLHLWRSLSADCNQLSVFEIFLLARFHRFLFPLVQWLQVHLCFFGSNHFVRLSFW